MTSDFIERESLEVAGYSLVAEIESIDPPRGYDQGGRPPRFRIGLRHNSETIYCESLSEVAKGVANFEFPIAAFFERYPAEVASMITQLEGLPRPIQNNPLFQGVDVEYCVSWSDLVPQFVGQKLQWFELPKFGENGIKRRTLSAKSFELVPPKRGGDRAAIDLG